MITVRIPGWHGQESVAAGAPGISGVPAPNEQVLRESATARSSGNTGPIVTVDGLRKTYGKGVGVQDVSFCTPTPLP